MKLSYFLLMMILFNHFAQADIVETLPKAELHLHLTGAYPLSYLRSIATKEEIEMLETNLEIISKGVPYHEAFKYFAPVEKLVNSPKKVENGVLALCNQLIDDGVIYAEIRTGLKDLGTGYEGYLTSVLSGMEGCPEAIRTRLLLSLRRSTPLELAKLTVDLAIKYRGRIVGIDISGDSTLGEMAAIAPEVLRAKSAGLFLTLHVGESFKEIDTPLKEAEQAEVLKLLKPHRIGHGVFLSKLSQEWLLTQSPKVALEVCPSSSVLAGMTDHHSNHPGLAYFLTEMHSIVVGTDDPLLFQTTLSKEYRKLMEDDRISIDQVKQMIEWSFDFAFLSPKEKLELKMRRATSKL